ncbi:dGTPase [Limnobacter thiooxidans]|uniref:Deoxyguanosinetriphosphate triphosphohydrolase-like protein n=1 Tax=Limnobacter thiooxidans TaxID=131080 RepID=A0AA86MBZ9_9BURK|nr:deoxyguanosinetriphosphate triphosphohydrolase [Limnobacter sp.]MCZ8015059.1 deoxyguanosinetriphosphate triphosphohydrolase [Limnobacter sp.]RZS40284.1 dGTPase [Limnobacter thiooxidans]BET27283.1 deoxyguanosinetriphosphate triphosphohydrolase [Limnobacter thiooxidans]
MRNFELSLAPYAVSSANTRGRLHPETSPEGRTEFERDRDRIIHSAAFRRLEYKTQVFVNTEGDLYRTRLTHSLEVAQIARSISRNLGLNEELTEAVALAHDLGHTPFGHAGQDALNECMSPHGGFEHNLQSLRVVDELEEKYASFNGLNLCFETRESILKHCSRPNAEKLGEVADRFLSNRRPVLEAQVTNLADEIAYNNHDIDDGLRSGLITLEQAAEVPLFKLHLDRVKARHPNLDGRRLIHEVVRGIINALVQDLLHESERRIALFKPTSVADVQLADKLIGFSSEMAELNHALKVFLRKDLYQHYQVLRATLKARRVVQELFQIFMEDPRLLPPQFFRRSELDVPRAIADYIAGMTDRYAMKEHQRLTVPGLQS